MSQTVQPMAPGDAARQQLQQLKTDSSQQLAQLMLEQQHKLSQMVQQLQVQQLQEQQPVAAPAPLSNVKGSAEGSTAGRTPALADALQLQQSNIGNMDLLLQRIHTTMHSTLATSGPQRGGGDDDKNGPAV
ncbi:hypothetical protein EOE67_16210 [Rheinheimera riviphila]|uniref:Uncharacterized protein n=1 Tax=Rheinheimera riviphila TaxID=1834037 RepID=A0A437QG78_9GAMM|nr:hypothetical protein [Rheinheimera riviphila]RVU33559.1 hypothetical protein EOE67_16210 [Rheinheimera riviphila]